ncbi:MAG: TIGR03619 family F420-dependent LLM class oxidoreductase, partial [Chloroflexota bacterium]|nr:TIGR03619 family F420-dependent LLM class oxidoreductase [Chloroflexota bacterium]
MAGKVSWGISIPQVFFDGPIDMPLIERWSKRAESLGFESLWTQEAITGAVPILEPVTLLSYLAAITEKVRLGTSVIVAPLRNPIQLAKSLGSLDHMSRGRLTVGLGLGGNPNDIPPYGLSSEKRVRRFTEIINVMKALWTQPEAHFQGEFWQLNGLKMEPKPLQKPHPPIWLGARHINALRRAVRHGDGWMGAGSSDTASFVTAVDQTKMYLEEADRDPGSFTISKRVYVAVDNDEDRAEGRLKEWFGKRYGNADMASQVSVWGSTAKVTEKLAKVTGAGAEMV